MDDIVTRTTGAEPAHAKNTRESEEAPWAESISEQKALFDLLARYHAPRPSPTAMDRVGLTLHQQVATDFENEPAGSSFLWAIIRAAVVALWAIMIGSNHLPTLVSARVLWSVGLAAMALGASFTAKHLPRTTLGLGVITGLVSTAIRIQGSTFGSIVDGARCAIAIIGCAALPLAIFWVGTRRRDSRGLTPISPMMTGAIASAGGLVGLAGLELSCPHQTSGHLMVAHFGTLAVAASLGVALGYLRNLQSEKGLLSD